MGKTECCKVKVSAVKMAQKGLQTSPVGFKGDLGFAQETVDHQAQFLRSNALEKTLEAGNWGAAAHHFFLDAFGFHGR